MYFFRKMLIFYKCYNDNMNSHNIIIDKTIIYYVTPFLFEK